MVFFVWNLWAVKYLWIPINLIVVKDLLLHLVVMCIISGQVAAPDLSAFKSFCVVGNVSNQNCISSDIAATCQSCSESMFRQWNKTSLLNYIKLYSKEKPGEDSSFITELLVISCLKVDSTAEHLKWKLSTKLQVCGRVLLGIFMWKKALGNF